MNRLWVVAVMTGMGCAPAATAGGGTPETPSPKPAIDGVTTAPREDRLVRLRPPATTRYALYRRDSVAVQMATGEAQVQTVGRTTYLSITATGQGPEYGLTLAVDSIRLDEDAVFPQIMIDSAVGARWTGRLLPNGRLADLSTGNTSAVAQQLQGQFRLLFPVLPSAGVKDADTWTDTARTTIKAYTFDATEDAVAHYHASRADTSGRTALRIESARDGRIVGSTTKFGQSMTLAGTVGGTVTYQVGLDGVLLGAEGTETVDMTITFESVGQALPAAEIARFTLTSLP